MDLIIGGFVELEAGTAETPLTPRTPGDSTSLRKVLDQRRQLVMELFQEEGTFFPSGKVISLLGFPCVATLQPPVLKHDEKLASQSWLV